MQWGNSMRRPSKGHNSCHPRQIEAPPSAVLRADIKLAPPAPRPPLPPATTRLLCCTVAIAPATAPPAPTPIHSPVLPSCCALLPSSPRRRTCIKHLNNAPPPNIKLSGAIYIFALHSFTGRNFPRLEPGHPTCPSSLVAPIPLLRCAMQYRQKLSSPGGCNRHLGTEWAVHTWGSTPLQSSCLRRGSARRRCHSLATWPARSHALRLLLRVLLRLLCRVRFRCCCACRPGLQTRLLLLHQLLRVLLGSAIFRFHGTNPWRNSLAYSRFCRAPLHWLFCL